jgi:mitotic spindle assembly checkpoint protein MAD2
MATARRHKTKTGTGAITLAGSSKMVTEFFEYSLNRSAPLASPHPLRTVAHALGSSILYQRGIYPPDDFKMVKKYGLTLCVTSDDTLERYIQTVMGQVNRTLYLPPE